MTNQELTAAEQLELHSLVALVKSAREKQQAGKPLTKREIAAVAELEQRQKQPANKPTIDALQIVRLIVSSQPQRCDEEAIRAVLGDSSTKSLPDIAAAFGVTHATVKHTWRANGMPGDGKRRQFPWADVLIWYLKRELANVAARGTDEYTSRKREAETRAAEAEARIKEHKAEVTEGEYVQLASVQADLRAMLNVVRDGFMAIPRKWTARFPAKYSREWTTELEADIRGVLTIIADRPIEDFIERINDQEN